MNQDLQVVELNNYLYGKTIALCVTGGIAAIEAPKIARHLRRYGANVKAYVTSNAMQFIGKTALEWGTNNEVIAELSGLAEHICNVDLILVAPATLNTINSIFTGLANNPVTTLIASALGKNIPVYIAPTMHESLYNNPILKNNLEKAANYGIKIINPRIGEGKAKIADIDVIVAEVCRGLATHPIKNKKILITGGPTPAKIDSVRRITNKFRGTLAVKIAKEAYLKGANVTLLLGNRDISVPNYLNVIYHDDYDEYYNNVISELNNKYDYGVFAAAVADYMPINCQEGKIPSGGAINEIKVIPTKKIIKEVRIKFPDLIMGTFKYETGVTKERLIEIAKERINQGYQYVIANRAEDMAETHKAYIVGTEGIILEPKSKDEIAIGLIDILGKID